MVGTILTFSDVNLKEIGTFQLKQLLHTTKVSKKCYHTLFSYKKQKISFETSCSFVAEIF